VVPKRVPLGSLREEFLIPGRKIVPRRNLGVEKLWMKKPSSVYYGICLFNVKNCTAR